MLETVVSLRDSAEMSDSKYSYGSGASQQIFDVEAVTVKAPEGATEAPSVTATRRVEGRPE